MPVSYLEKIGEGYDKMGPNRNQKFVFFFLGVSQYKMAESRNDSSLCTVGGRDRHFT